MNLRAFLATMSVFMLSHPLFCIPSNTSELLEESYKFSIQNSSKNTDYIKAVLEKFNKFYDELESDEDRAALNFDFQHDPFLNKKNFREVQHDPEMQRYVQHLYEYAWKKFTEAFNHYRQTNPDKKNCKMCFFIKQFKKEYPQVAEIVTTIKTVADLFNITLTDQIIRYIKNNSKIIGITCIAGLLLLGGYEICYAVGYEVGLFQRSLEIACDKAINEAFDTK